MSQTDHQTVYTRVKTRLPAPAAELIERPRLLATLRQSADAKLTLVQAPAGYGKTSLLQQWGAQLNEGGAEVAWLTLDQDEREPRVFLSYLMHALEEAKHSIDEPLRSVIASESMYSWKVVATHLANSFVGASTPIHFFLDDVQYLRDSPALKCLQHLLESTPAELRFVLSSREDPGILLGRLRAIGRVFELRAKDLRFAREETIEYFAKQGHAPLTSTQLTALESRAEGWIVGLKLLSMAMRWNPQEALSAQTVSGEQRQIADYFAEDVLARQPAELGDFLLRTCILDRLCPALCDALPGVRESRSFIDLCDAGGLFLLSLDQTRTWYRYHPLFGDFLRRQLSDRSPGLAEELCVAASRWLEQAGFHSEAFEYALKGKDPIRAAEILDAQCDTMWSAGRQQLIQTLASRLPPHVQALYPRILLAIAWRLVAQWEIDEAKALVAVSRARVSEMERATPDAPAVRSLRRRVLHRESQIAHHLYQLESVERISRQLLTDNDPTDHYLTASVSLTLQYAQREQYELAEMHRLLEMSRVAMQQTGFSHGLVFHAAVAGPSYFLAGRVREAIQVLTRGLEIARDLTGAGSSLGSVVGLHLAQVFYECNDIEAATELMHEYFRVSEDLGILDQIVAGRLTHSRLARLRGDFTTALETLSEAAEFAERHSMQRLKLASCAEHVRLLLRMGRPDEAALFAKRNGLARSIEQTVARRRLTTANGAQALAWCRLAAAQDKVTDALAVARRWRAHVTTAGAIQAAVEWGVTLAELLVLAGDRRAALRALWQAVAQAAPARLARVFLDEGMPVTMLLEQMAGGGAGAEDTVQMFIRELLASSVHRHDRQKRPCVGSSGPEKTVIAGRMNSRELEILAMAGSGMLNKKISEKLGLTEGTVKWYLQQVFDKLGVRDRTLAAAKARELGLIA